MNAKEALAKPPSGHSVRFRRRLGVHSESEARVTVAQAGLGSLAADPQPWCPVARPAVANGSSPTGFLEKT
jgi:hypothetical protein